MLHEICVFSIWIVGRKLSAQRKSFSEGASFDMQLLLN